MDEESVTYSLSFQVHARLWPCWRVVCNCGVAVREDNDVVTIDMCHGPWRRTSPRVIQKSRRPLGNRMRIRRYGSGQSTRFKVCDLGFFMPRPVIKLISVKIFRRNNLNCNVVLVGNQVHQMFLGKVVLFTAEVSLVWKCTWVTTLPVEFNNK